MKNNKGISLMTLLVTVIVIIIISSISVYNGINLLKDARQKDAEDRLKAICSAILKDDSFLEFNGGNTVELTEDHFDYMDLTKYYDNDFAVIVQKIESGDVNHKVMIYDLVMKEKDSSTQYEYSIEYTMNIEKYNYTPDFDTTNGVNRPIVVEGMTAITFDGNPVEDIYKDNWYSYNENSLSFARVKTEDGKIFVWIPRFAYGIQNFYNGRVAKEVPNTAISIAFLRGTTNYMSNDEIIPANYKIHPAFSNGSIQYSGIWVEEVPTSGMSILSAYFEDFGEYEAHMMTNEECGAALYLMYALDDMSEVIFEDAEYVAACIESAAGKFSISQGFYSEYELGEDGKADISKKFGDALFETPWGRVLEDAPTAARPYLIRRFDSSLFDFTNSTGTEVANFRRVISIK